MTRSDAKTNILLFGMGGIGSTYAYLFSQASNTSTHVVARSNHAVLSSKGLAIDSVKFGKKEGVKFAGVWKSAGDAKEGLGDGEGFNYIVCCTKALLKDPSDPNALENLIAPAVTEGKTTIVIIQNGVGAEEPIRTRFPTNPLLTSVTWIGALLTTHPSTPDVPSSLVKNNNFPSPIMQIGPGSPLCHSSPVEEEMVKREMERSEEIRALLEGVSVGEGEEGVRVEVKSDMGKERWTKVVWNAAWNPTTALIQTNTYNLMTASPYGEEMCRKLMREVITVAQALKYDVPFSTIDQLMDKCKSHNPTGLNSSMQADVRSKSPSEVEVILGTPLREGRRLGIETPILEVLFVLMKGMEREWVK